MHHCLTIPEILAHITSFLSSPDLISTALISQSFKPYALRSLWQHLPDLSPVLRNFPHSKWRTQKEHFRFRMDMVWLYSLVKELVPQDWEPLLPYLPMIRSIDSNHEIEISDAFLRNITKTFPGQKLFPNLRRFSLSDNYATEDMLTLVQSFLGPQLQRLSIGECSERTPTSFVRFIPVHCPSLKTLEFDYRTDIQAISEAVCQCQYLEELTIPSPTEAALIHASQLPALRKLAIDFSSDSPLQFPSTPLPAFPKLMDLTINDGTMSFHASIHAIISSSRYRDYEASFDEAATVTGWKNLFVQLKVAAPHGPRTVLFTECVPEEFMNNNPDYLITPDTLQTFLTFSSLMVLDMSAVYPFDLDDAFVLDLAKACPELEIVDFGTTWHSHRRSRATLMAYVHLVRYCPDLISIGLIVDASHADRNSKINPSRDVPHYIRTDLDEPFEFKVGDSYIKDSLAVAAFLSSLIYPGSNDIIKIVTVEECPSDKAKAWKSVEKMLPAFVAVRAQERLPVNLDQSQTQGGGA